MDIRIILIGENQVHNHLLKKRIYNSNYKISELMSFVEIPDYLQFKHLSKTLIFVPQGSFDSFKLKQPDVLSENIVLYAYSSQVPIHAYQSKIFAFIAIDEPQERFNDLIAQFVYTIYKLEYYYTLLEINKRLELLLTKSHPITFLTTEGLEFFSLAKINTCEFVEDGFQITHDSGVFKCIDRKSELEKMLSRRGFLRFGESKMVNRYKVTQLIHSELFLINGASVMVENSYLKQLKTLLKQSDIYSPKKFN